MKCMADLCVIPMGEGVSVRNEVAACERVLQRFPIETHLHAYGTNLYGDWDDVFAAIKACHEELHQAGVVRLTSTIKVGTRTDKDQTPDEKRRVVEDLLNEGR